MQDVDCPAHVQALAQPARDRGPRAQDDPVRLVRHAHLLDRIVGHTGRRRDLGQGLSVRAAKAKLPGRLSVDLVALLVHGAVMAATEQRQIRERGGAAVRPVTKVMALAKANCAAREAAAAVSVMKCAP
jgi:hypothetical protein